MGKPTQQREHDAEIVARLGNFALYGSLINWSPSFVLPAGARFVGPSQAGRMASSGVSRVQANSLKEYKSLVQRLSKEDSELTLVELKMFQTLTERFGGKLRYDLNPVHGRFLKPHVQVEGLGKSLESRHVWLGPGVR